MKILHNRSIKNTLQIMCSSLYFLNLPVSGAALENDPMDRIMQKIHTIQTQIDQHQDQLQHRNAIVIIGPSGVGKSSLTYLLGGQTLVSQHIGGMLALEPQNPLPNLDIGHGILPGTKEFYFMEQPDENRLIIDTCGFGSANGLDPNGPDDDIINAFAVTRF